MLRVVSFNLPVRRLVVSLVSVIAALTVVSGKAAAVSDEDYFVDVYLAAQDAAAIQRHTDLIIENGMPADSAPELYRKAQVCFGKVLFKHVTRAEVTYLRTHNDGIRLRAGSGAVTPDIQGILQRSAERADAGERARCLWYEAGLAPVLDGHDSGSAVRDLKCRHIKDADFACSFWVEPNKSENQRTEHTQIYRWDDGWSVVRR